MKPIIKVENLSKQYKIGENRLPYSTFRESIVNSIKAPFKSRKKTEANSFWALKDINFEINPGEVVGIIGRNGAGKSTLLKVLSRITEPTTGQIALYGRVGSLLEVGTGFHSELTGRENIFLNGAILGMRREEIARKFDEIVDFAEVEKFIDTPVKHYSSGMYVRLAFAVAANLDPEILIIDEVLAVGDTEFQKKCLGKMKSVSEHGRTVLFVSHQMSAIAKLCSYGIMMKKGKIIYEGQITNVIEKYLSNSSNISHDYLAEEEEDKPAQIIWASIIDEKGNSTVEFRHDEDIVLKFKIKNFSSEKEMKCGIGLWNLMDILIAVEVINIAPNSGYQSYKLTIPKGMLAPNKLKFSLAIYIPGKVIDLVTEFLSLEIVDLGFRSTLKADNHGLVYLKSKLEEIDG